MRNMHLFSNSLSGGRQSPALVFESVVSMELMYPLLNHFHRFQRPYWMQRVSVKFHLTDAPSTTIGFCKIHSLYGVHYYSPRCYFSDCLQHQLHEINKNIETSILLVYNKSLDYGHDIIFSMLLTTESLSTKKA